MATVTWNYFFNRTVAPGETVALSWGPDNAFKGATFSVTAYPATILRNTNYSLTVSLVSIANVDIGQGDINNVTTMLWAKVTNAGNPGDGTVKSFTVYVTRNTP